MYSNTINYVVNVGNESYPYIQQSVYGKYCLICKKEVLENVQDHIFLQKHNDKSLKSELFYKIKEFHIEWLNLPMKYQLQQIFIKMKSSDKYTCSLCKSKGFLLRNLKQHLDTQKHQQQLNSMAVYFGYDRKQLENLLDFADCEYTKSHNRNTFLLVIRFSNVNFVIFETLV